MTAERITSIRMSAFRGIPETFNVDLHEGKSLLLLGPNATGKSTIADAVEWHLSGEIELLQHEGRHGDIRNRGANEDVPTFVCIDTNGELGGETWVDSSLGDAPRTRTVGETFLLRGSTLQRFINLTKGKKWDELAYLLGLEEVDALRKDLQRASNALARTKQTTIDRLEHAVDLLAPICSVENDAELWSEVLAACETAEVLLPESLDEALDPDWVAGTSASSSATEGIAVSERLAAQLSQAPSLEVDVTSWNAAADLLASDVAREIALLNAAESLFESNGHLETCPLCRQEVDGDVLRLSVDDRLRSLRDQALARDQASETLAEITERVVSADESRRAIVDAAKEDGIVLPDLPEEDLIVLSSVVNSGDKIAAADVLRLSEQLVQWDEDVRGALTSVGGSEPASPNPVATLVRLVERGRSWRKARIDSVRDGLAAERALTIHDACARLQAELFDEMLSAISQPLDEIYSRLHPGESLTGAAVEKIGDKGLELSIEFHGAACRPPHGVLSESHLNSLAIAVFLAMAETFNDQVGFLVLDDVVSSFDIEHRIDLAELLVERYEDWQLIVLTHDRRFFEHIRRTGTQWRSEELTSWDFDSGPRLLGYVTTDLATRARAQLNAGDTLDAARTARRSLEELLYELCEGIGAPLPFKRGTRNERRDAQELIDGARRKVKKLDGTTKAVLLGLLRGFEADLQVTLNSEVHASDDWASDGEVDGAIARIEGALSIVSCASCATRVWKRWNDTTGSCRCGELRIPPTMNPSMT